MAPSGTVKAQVGGGGAAAGGTEMSLALCRSILKNLVLFSFLFLTIWPGAACTDHPLTLKLHEVAQSLMCSDVSPSTFLFHAPMHHFTSQLLTDIQFH